jgi:hypothetical protein
MREVAMADSPAKPAGGFANALTVPIQIIVYGSAKQSECVQALHSPMATNGYADPSDVEGCGRHVGADVENRAVGDTDRCLGRARALLACAAVKGHSLSNSPLRYTAGESIGRSHRSILNRHRPRSQDAIRHTTLSVRLHFDRLQPRQSSSPVESASKSD